MKLGFNKPEEAAKIVEELNGKFSKQGIDYHGVMLYKMVPYGTEMMIGANRDATFGPITVSGLGGTMVEILKDVVFNMCPVTIEEATLSLKNLNNAELYPPHNPKVDETKIIHLLFVFFFSLIKGGNSSLGKSFFNFIQSKIIFLKREEYSLCLYSSTIKRLHLTLLTSFIELVILRVELMVFILLFILFRLCPIIQFSFFNKCRNNFFHSFYLSVINIVTFFNFSKQITSKILKIGA